MKTSTARRLSRLHAVLYRTTGGRIGRRLVDNDMLLLTTRGRTSGKRHTVPLLYLEEGGTLAIIASWGGKDHHPHWYLNLVAEPTATVNVNGTIRTVTARTADGAERTKWWERAVQAYDGYARYQERTDRQIPVVLLET